ncbi:plasmid mobilization protein, partial [Streptococcus suis]
MSDIKQVQIIIRVSKEERSKIKEMAQYNGISVNEFIQ